MQTKNHSNGHLKKTSLQPIRLLGVRQNNLKNISVEFPSRKLTVITGVSGSGKSSLAFDTLYAEGQRRYIESLSTYVRQFLEKMPRPEIDSVENIPPALALEQRNPVFNSRSTVATQTELLDYLRILFSKIGKTQCIDCGTWVELIDSQSILRDALGWFPGKKALLLAPLLPSTSSSKAKKTKGASPRPVASLQSTLTLIREQGFRRILYKKSSKTHLLIDLDEPDSLKTLQDHALEKKNLFLVIDRLALKKNDESEDQRTRLLEAIENGLAVGQGRLSFYELDTQKEKEFEVNFACPKCARVYRKPEPQLFSFNNPLGACPQCSGFGFTLDLDESRVVPDPTKTLKNGAIDPFSKPSFEDWQKDLFRFAERHGISIGKRYSELTPKQKELLWKGDQTESAKTVKTAKSSGAFPGILGCFQELQRWKYKLHVRVFVRRYQSQTLCSRCEGTRLQIESLAVKVGNLNIAQVLAMSVADALQWFEQLELAPTEFEIAKEMILQVHRRLYFLNAVGVEYITLNRLAKTLSGGEFQRINLATQLGSGLCGSLYVLDEPSIGLHAADTARLIEVLVELRDQGNTIVAVEHDLSVMKAADWLVELGPGAGKRGGEILAYGTFGTLQKNPASLTGKYLSGTFHHQFFRAARKPSSKQLRLVGCREHNLKNIDVEFPLERFVVVTGVSGSGKTTLVHKTLYPALLRLFPGSSGGVRSFRGQSSYGPLEVGTFNRLYGAENITGVVLLDQKPIGKSSRSNPATYLQAWDEIRRIYANQVLSLRRGYTPQYFSFNVEGGRCPVCKGEGEVTLDMHFMAEVKLPCEECEGRRFKKNILDVTYKGKNIHQLLQLTIDEAYDLFRDNPPLVRKLGILRDVGLGYLLLGQSGLTLSGGESQRLKIASALESRSGQHLLYIFDEPTTGLHLDDIQKLLSVLQDLVEARNSIVMIEHHLDVIAQSDWIIDLGPGGGTQGGRVVCTGTPAQILKNTNSLTGKCLREQGYQERIQSLPKPELDLV